jgi:uncharacterized RDD family membrane protein YckC
MILMKPNSPMLRRVRFLAALIPFAAAAFAADPAKPQDPASPAPDAPLHEIGAPTDAPTPTPRHEHMMNDGSSSVVHQFDDEDHNRVSVSDSTYVGPQETVPGNAVAVLGPLKIDGTVNGNAVSVLGSNTINGTVHGNAVVVLGTMRLGPHAHVDGNTVAGVGLVLRDPGAYVGGNVVQQGVGVNFDPDSGAYSWWHHALRHGRPMAIGPKLHVFWLLSICMAGLYVLLALIFPGGVTKCGDTLVHRPGITFLTGILAIIALPVVFILLLITVVGIPIALIVLPIAVVCFITFGKTAIYALIGRSIAKKAHPALAVLVGVAVVILFYLVPVLGGILWIVVAFLGYGCAVATLFSNWKPAAPAPVVPPAIPAGPAAPALVVPGSPEAPGAPDAVPANPGVPAALVSPLPPPLAATPESALPKAGFWVRMVALLIDCVLIGIITQGHDWFPILLASYGAVLWKLRGATVGDIIFGLKVVRVDGAPLEWVTVIVRALACFFSVLAVGLGFIWIAFDREKQAWHDKIAGTVVVKLHKGSSLV